MGRIATPSQLNFQLLETKLVWVQDRLLEKSWKTNAITIDDIPVWLVRRGRLVVLMGKERIEAGSGNWIFPRQGQGWVHTLPDSKILSFRFRLRWPNGQEIYRRRRTLVLKSSGCTELTRATTTLLGQLDRKTSWYADQWTPASCTDFLSMQGHFYRWLEAYGRIMDAHGQEHSIVDEADVSVLVIRKALVDWDLGKPFSRKSLSRQLGVGIQTISRRFAAYYGTTPRGFLEQRKLEWAQQRLAQSQERVKIIAAELGFLNLAQFSNWFRLRNQIAPREYRRFSQEDLSR